MRQRVLWAIGCAVAALLLLLFLFPGRQPAPSPSPNGCDDLQNIAGSVIANPGDWRTQNVEELRAALAPNSNALRVVRDALRKEWAVPISYGPTAMNSMLPILTATKALAQLFCAEGRLAELSGRTNEALNAFVDCIQLGHQSSRRGLIIHEQVGMACQAIGNRAIQNSWPAADDNTLKHALDSLAEIDRFGARVDETLRRDRSWSRATYGMLRFAWLSFVTRSTVRDVEEHFRTRRLRSEADLRLLRTDVAIEMFRRKTSRMPVSLNELVPQWLDAAPVDPFSGKLLVYRGKTTSYLLYSVGPDKKDDGGASLTNMRQGPLLFDTDSDKGDLVSKPPQRR